MARISSGISILVGNSSATLVNTEIANGGFELDSVPLYWNTMADVRIITKLGELSPTEGAKMAMLSTGIGAAKEDYILSFEGATQGSILQQKIKLTDTVNTLTFDYNMVSEEPQEYIGTQYDDTFIAEILDPNGKLLEQLVYESVNTSTWKEVSGFKLTQGQISGRPAWQTGWETKSVDLKPYRGQVITLRFIVFDRGDALFDSAGLVDNVLIK